MSIQTRSRTRMTVAALVAAAALAACEDGPSQVYTPDDQDPAERNNGGKTPFTPDGDQNFGSSAGTDDNAGRARFCNEQENEQMVQSMVVAPIVPDESIGRVPMRNADGTPVLADDLIGRPEDNKFCDPTIYSNALTWGPVDEVIAFIDTETRLLTDLVAYSQYLGNMNCAFPGTDENGQPAEIPVTIKLRERIKIGDQELDQYTSRADQASNPNAWLNNDNINRIYRAVRATYFNVTVDPSYDCVATKVCNTFYQSEEAQEVRQATQLYFIDSEVVMAFSPEGEVQFVLLSPVRRAPFETGTRFEFGEGDVLTPTLVSTTQAACQLDMSRTTTWGQFKRDCIGEDTRTLDRASYDVYTQRDAVSVGFNGVTLDFQRDIVANPVLADGERPADADQLVGLTFTRTLNAPVKEFVPRDLAWDYRAKLLQRIRASVKVPAPVEPPPEDPMDPMDPMDPVEPAEPAEPEHPFLSFTLELPDSLSEDPQPIEQLFWDGPSGRENWNNTVIAEIRAVWNSLTEEQRAQVDPQVIEPTWIIEPFVDVVIEAFTHGKMDPLTSYKAFRNTDDRKWVIGYASFLVDGVPYRLVVQYSLNYGAVTAVTIGRGYSKLDELYAAWADELREPQGFGQPKYPYFGIDLARLDPDTNPFALGGDGVRLLLDQDGNLEPESINRQLATIDVRVTAIADGRRSQLELTVPGDPIVDRNGYLRQIRGQRYEWVPATVVRLSGRETGMIFYIEADGRIGRIGEGGFKRPVTLCPGLDIAYGDDIREQVEAFTAAAGIDAYRQCEIVFNYSANGNVLDGVASITNRVSFVTVNGRAVQADVWR